MGICVFDDRLCGIIVLQFQNLYRLHIRNSDVPPDFAHLLQLREMLDIKENEAEEIEMLVMERPPPLGL